MKVGKENGSENFVIKGEESKCGVETNWES